MWKIPLFQQIRASDQRVQVAVAVHNGKFAFATFLHHFVCFFQRAIFSGCGQLRPGRHDRRSFGGTINHKITVPGRNDAQQLTTDLARGSDGNARDALLFRDFIQIKQRSFRSATQGV